MRAVDGSFPGKCELQVGVDVTGLRSFTSLNRQVLLDSTSGQPRALTALASDQGPTFPYSPSIGGP